MNEYHTMKKAIIASCSALVIIAFCGIFSYVLIHIDEWIDHYLYDRDLQSLTEEAQQYLDNGDPYKALSTYEQIIHTAKDFETSQNREPFLNALFSSANIYSMLGFHEIAATTYLKVEEIQKFSELTQSESFIIAYSKILMAYEYGMNGDMKKSNDLFYSTSRDRHKNNETDDLLYSLNLIYQLHLFQQRKEHDREDIILVLINEQFNKGKGHLVDTSLRLITEDYLNRATIFAKHDKIDKAIKSCKQMLKLCSHFDDKDSVIVLIVNANGILYSIYQQQGAGTQAERLKNEMLNRYSSNADPAVATSLDVFRHS